MMGSGGAVNPKTNESERRFTIDVVILWRKVNEQS